MTLDYNVKQIQKKIKSHLTPSTMAGTLGAEMDKAGVKECPDRDFQTAPDWFCLLFVRCCFSNEFIKGTITHKRWSSAQQDQLFTRVKLFRIDSP